MTPAGSRNLDILLTLSVGKKALSSARVERVRTSWRLHAEQMQQHARLPITAAEFLALDDAQRGKRKASAGFHLTGVFTDDVRSAANFISAQLLTFDVDRAALEALELVRDGAAMTDTALLWYSTTSHMLRGEAKLRIELPLSRAVVSVEEYAALARKVAAIYGLLPFVDRTCLRATQLMYNPVACADAPVVSGSEGAQPIDVDAMLACYGAPGAWRDAELWPRCPGEDSSVSAAKKRRDPRDGNDWPAAFCRVYPVSVAVAEFIPDRYAPVPNAPNRLQWIGPGSSRSNAAGVVVYDDLLLYSHHESDPCNNGHAASAFDVVRIHRFGDLDLGSKAKEPAKLPSYRAMVEFCKQDEAVRLEHAGQRTELPDDVEAVEEVDGPGAAPTAPRAARGLPPLDTPRPPEGWSRDLYVDDELRFTRVGAAAWLRYGAGVAGTIGFNTLSGRWTVVRPAPWMTGPATIRPFCGMAMGDAEHAQLLCAAERAFPGCTVAQATYFDALNSLRSALAYDPVTLWLDHVADTVMPATDDQAATLMSRYLGVADTPMAREVTQALLIAIVARQYDPGHPFQLAPILKGPQGCGKSTFCRLLAPTPVLFGDALPEMGRDTRSILEYTMGKVVIELAELAGSRRSEQEQIKAFISRTVDSGRMAYAREALDVPRRFVLIGTTNEDQPLQDHSGARRHPVFETGRQFVEHEDMAAEMPSLYSWAVRRWRQDGAVPELSQAARVEAASVAQEFTSRDPAADIAELLQPWLAQPIAVNHWSDEPPSAETMERTRVCMAEVRDFLSVRMGVGQAYLIGQNRLVGRALRILGWRASANRWFGRYGVAKAFVSGPKDLVS